MMKALQQAVNYLSDRWWRVLVMMLINLINFQLLFGLEDRFKALTGLPTYDTQNDLTATKLLDQLGLYQGDALAAYYRFAVYDFVFPSVAGLFVAVVVSWLLKRNPTPLAGRLLAAKVPLIVFVGTLCDFGENFGLLSILQIGAAVPDSVLQVTILFKRLKLAMLGVSASMMIAALIFTVGALLLQRNRLAV